MSTGNERSWPFLSPARNGWRLVPGTRGQIRRIVTGQRSKLAHDDELIMVLDAIVATGQVMTGLERDVLALVSEANFRGASWAEIARRLDRTKQSVHQRYQRRIHSRQTRELLVVDANAALRRAVELCQGGSGDEAELAEARAFLRERRITTAGPPGGHAARRPPARSDSRT